MTRKLMMERKLELDVYFTLMIVIDICDTYCSKRNDGDEEDFASFSHLEAGMPIAKWLRNVIRTEYLREYIFSFLLSSNSFVPFFKMRGSGILEYSTLLLDSVFQ